MNDLREAIHDLLYYSAPMVLNGKREYRVIRKELLDVLIAEYNIHFVEPEDRQFELPPHPMKIECTDENIKIST